MYVIYIQKIHLVTILVTFSQRVIEDTAVAMALSVGLT